MKFPKFEVKSRNENSGRYLKIEDGESVVAVLRGEIQMKYLLWANGKSEEVVPGTPGAKPRFSVNAVIHENGKFVAKVWDFSTTTCGELEKINERDPLATTKIRITRHGVKLDTIYEIKALFGDKDKLTSQQLQEIETVELNDLDKKVKAKSQEKPDSNDIDGWSF
jgi:hypothetical protein